MTKVTIKTAADTAEAPAAINAITDSKGRALKLRELGPLEESRVVRCVGSDAAINSVYMSGYVIPACLVEEIDGLPAPLPATQREVDAAIQRVGREGLEAVLNHLHGKGAEDAKGDAKN